MKEEQLRLKVGQPPEDPYKTSPVLRRGQSSKPKRLPFQTEANASDFADGTVKDSGRQNGIPGPTLRPKGRRQTTQSFHTPRRSIQPPDLLNGLASFLPLRCSCKGRMDTACQARVVLAPGQKQVAAVIRHGHKLSLTETF